MVFGITQMYTRVYSIRGDRSRLRIKTEQKAIKYDQKIRNLNDQRLVRQCWKEKVANKLKINSNVNRLEYLRRNSLSQEGLEYLYREKEVSEVGIRKSLAERDRKTQLQVQYGRSITSKYNSRFKHIRYTLRPEYLVKKETKGS